MVRVNDLIPAVSGAAALGIDMTSNLDGFDITTLTPFNRFHVLSGVFHDPTLGNSGVLRYVGGPTTRFEQSLDGGKTFSTIASTANTVTSVGVIGDANLTGDVDFASPASGFIVIQDTADASPLLWSVNTLGLSGLYGFPSQGFPTQIPRSYSTTVTNQTSVAVTHNLNTSGLLVQVYDVGGSPNWFLPDSIAINSVNQITLGFNRSTTARVNIIGIL